jgi:AcrR family transcriptional regulator
MFNSNGVSIVSTRHIADRMDISVGNLHYHFSGKDELILALYQRFLQETEALADLLAKSDPGQMSLSFPIEETFELIYKYRFLFEDRIYLTRRMPDLKQSFKKMIDLRRKEFLVIVDKLISKQLLRQGISDQQLDALWKHIVILYNSWINNMDLFDDIQSPKEMARVVAAIWIPYLSEDHEV